MSARFIEEIRCAEHGLEHQAAYLELAQREPDSHLKTSGPVHFTASAIVIDQSGEHIALHLHRKVGAWLQFGGHIEPGEARFEQAARREALEESGLDRLERVGAGPAVLHPHDLGSGFTVCRAHWDVQYLFRAPVSVQASGNGEAVRTGLAISERESAGLAWFPLTALPADLVPDLHDTLRILGLMTRR